MIITLRFKDGDGNPLDLTNSSLALTIRESKDSDVLYSEFLDDTGMIDPVNGIAAFVIASEVTELWAARTNVYDIIWNTSAGTHVTMLIGSFRVLKPIHIDPVTP